MDTTNVLFKTPLTTIEENSKLLFYDSFKNEKSQFTIEEIFFGKPVVLHQLRVIKAETNPHPKIRTQMSITQSSPIYNFEVFGRSMTGVSDVFEKIVECQTINEAGIQDCIFPFYSKFVTNHLIIRGTYEKLTLCIYGATYSNQESFAFLEAAKTEVNLEKLNSQIANRQKENEFKNMEFPLDTVTLEENMELMKNYSLNDLILPYLKCNCEDEIKKTLSLMPPNFNMIEKTKIGYVYYENELLQIIQNLLTLYSGTSAEKSNPKKISSSSGRSNSFLQSYASKLNNRDEGEAAIDQVLFFEYFQRLIDILKILLQNNNVLLEDICVFNQDNYQIFSKLPEGILEIVMNALEGGKFGITEIIFAIQLSKLMASSESFVKGFIVAGGFESLYNLLLTNSLQDQINHKINQKFYIEIPSNIKNLVLELIYSLISHKDGVLKFLGHIDKSKLIRNYFSITEISPDRPDFLSLNKQIEIYSESRIRKRKDRHYKDKGKEKHGSRSNSRSSKNSWESANSATQDKSGVYYTKQTRLKNGYQIVLSQLAGKKNNLLISLVQKIISKITFSIYLMEFDRIVCDYIYKPNSMEKDSEETKQVDLSKLSFSRLSRMITKIYSYVKTLDIDYLKSDKEDEDYWFSVNYPYHHFWSNLSKISHLFFKKLDVDYNLKSNLNIDNKFSKLQNDRMTNELANLLEGFNFIKNTVVLLSVEQFKSNDSYNQVGFELKSFLSLILNLNGGVNFFSKNFEDSVYLLQYIGFVTQPLVESCKSLLSIKNFFSLSSDLESNPDYLFDTIVIAPLFIHKSKEINAMLSNQSNVLNFHLLQLKYFLEESFKLLSKIDDLKAYKLEEQDFVDKSLTVLIYLSVNSNSSNISKQAFICLLTSDSIISEFISLLKMFEESNPLEYEPHITLIIEMLTSVFTSTINNTKINNFILVYGLQIYETIRSIKARLDVIYESEMQEPCLPSFLDKVNSFINLMKCSNTLVTGETIHPLMVLLNESCFASVQKYYLNEKPIKDDQFKDETVHNYVKGMKMNILNYNTKDPYFFGELESKASLINGVFMPLRLLNISTWFNTLLLIDSVSDSLHLALRFLLVNGVNSLKYFLSQETSVPEKNNFGRENEKPFSFNLKGVNYVKENCIVLSQVLELLINLLQTLLSSHVDNFRDNHIVNSIVSLILVLVDYLGNTYSREVKLNEKIDTDREEKPDDGMMNEYCLIITEELQRLFEKSIGFMKELVKFHTSIKLSFESILEKIAESPENKPGILVLINFILRSVRNEFTLEIFMDSINKHQTPYLSNLYDALENSFKSQTIKLEDMSKDNSAAMYIIDIGMETNNNFMAKMSSEIILAIMLDLYIVGRDLAINTNNKMIERIISKIKNSFDKTKNSYIFMEDKEIEELVPQLDTLYKHIRYTLLFLQSEFKFLFIFHNIAQELLNVYTYLMDFIYSSVFANCELLKTDKSKEMKNKIYDLCILLLNCFHVLLDHNIGFKSKVREGFIGETPGSSVINQETNQNNIKHVNGKSTNVNGSNSSLNEELPSKALIINIVTELKKLLEPTEAIKLFFEKKLKKQESNSLLFYINSVNYSLQILTKISRTFYGQVILTHSDYPEGKKTQANPLINLHQLFNLYYTCLAQELNLLNLGASPGNPTFLPGASDIMLVDQYSPDQKKFKKNVCQRLLKTLISYTHFMMIMLYDLHHFEYLSYKKYEENKITSQNLNSIFSLRLDFNNPDNKILLSESRAEAYVRLFLKVEPFKEGMKSKKGIKEAFFGSLAEIFSVKNSLLKIKELDYLINVFNNSSCKISIQSDHSFIKLDFQREHDIKYEMLIKYQDFLNTQAINHSRYLYTSLDKTAVINQGSMLSLKANSVSNIDQNNKTGSSFYPGFTGLLNHINRIHNYSITPIHDFEKLLSWKKQRIYSSREHSFIIRTENFDVDVHSKCSYDISKSTKIKNPIEKMIVDAMPFDLYYKSNYYIKQYEYINNDPFQQFHNTLVHEGLKSYQATKISQTIFEANFQLKFINTFNDPLFVQFTELNKFAYAKQNSLNESLLGVSLTQTDKPRKKINSKINSLIYIPKYEKMPKNSQLYNPTMTYPTNNILITKEVRGCSVVGGRGLSRHVDNFAPDMKVIKTSFDNNLVPAGSLTEINDNKSTNSNKLAAEEGYGNADQTEESKNSNNNIQPQEPNRVDQNSVQPVSFMNPLMNMARPGIINPMIPNQNQQNIGKQTIPINFNKPPFNMPSQMSNPTQPIINPNQMHIPAPSSINPHLMMPSQGNMGQQNNVNPMYMGQQIPINPQMNMNMMKNPMSMPIQQKNSQIGIQYPNPMPSYNQPIQNVDSMQTPTHNQYKQSDYSGYPHQYQHQQHIQNSMQHIPQQHMHMPQNQQHNQQQQQQQQQSYSAHLSNNNPETPPVVGDDIQRFLMLISKSKSGGDKSEFSQSSKDPRDPRNRKKK